MSLSLLLLLTVGLALAGWLAGRARAWGFRKAGGGTRLAALPSYHGWYVALWIAGPLLAFVLLWTTLAPDLVHRSVLADPAAAGLPAFDFQRNAILAQARAVALGAAATTTHPDAAALVEPYREAIARYRLIGILVTLGIAIAAGAFAFLRLRPNFAARTKVERAVLAVLLTARSSRS
jgi:phosphate transport system permease protein